MGKLTVQPVLIAVLLFCILMAVRGIKKGLLRMTASIAGVAVSMAAARLLMPYLAARMKQNSAWVLWAETEVLPKLRVISADTLFSVLSFLIIFAAALILIRVLVYSLERLTEHTVLSALNQALGGVLGLAEAAVYLWAGLIFVQIMPQLPVCQRILEQVHSSPLLTAFSENNLLVILLQEIIGA